MQVTCSIPFFRVCTKRWVMVPDIISKWRPWKLVGCCKLSLYANESCDGHAILFSAMIEMMRYLHHIFASWQWCNFSRFEAFDFLLFIYTYSINLETIVEYDIKSKYLEEYSTIDKVGRLINSEKLLARKFILFRVELIASSFLIS